MLKLLEIPPGLELRMALESRRGGHWEQQYPAVQTALYQLCPSVSFEEFSKGTVQLGHEFRSDRSVAQFLPLHGIQFRHF